MNNIEVKMNNSDCAAYTGTVTVASYLGDRLIHKETHHNAGLNNLFKFIGSCLQGNWYEAKFNRPCKLVLLKEAEGENLNNPAITETYSTPLSKPDYWRTDYAVSNPIMYDTAASAEFNIDEGKVSSSVTYHFRIPFLSLTSGTTIKKLMLLPSIATDYSADACAYFVLEDAIKVPEAGKNFTVIIDWTLTFTNNE